MPADARVAGAQAALVAALASGDPSLAGFDEARLRAMSELLRGKRRRGVARSCPVLARALTERFAPLFDEYARATPLRSSDAAIDDAVRFLAWLRHRDLVPRELRFLSLTLRLRLLRAALLAPLGFRRRFASRLFRR